MGNSSNRNDVSSKNDAYSSTSDIESRTVEIKHFVKENIKEPWCKGCNKLEKVGGKESISTGMAQPIRIDRGYSIIYGMWIGEFCGVRFILNFSEDGEMSEKTDGVIRCFSYSLKNRVLAISPPISDLNCILGEELNVSFIDSDSMIVRGDLWKMEMVRIGASELVLPYV